MKYIFSLLLVLIFIKLNAQSDEDTNYYKYIIKRLTSTELKGRPSGGFQELLTIDFIKSEIRKSNHKEIIQKFSYQDIDSNKLLNSHNIYTFINNKKDSTIILCAHYDHLGYSLKKSNDLRSNGYHQGADDNASGVALVLNLLNNNTLLNYKKYNYLFVFYGAHEQGLFGSTFFYNNSIKNYKIKFVLNFDMVGRMTNNIVTVYTNNKFEKNKLSNKINIIGEGKTKLKSLDTKSFSENNVSCISFTTGLHADYHSVNDIESKINYVGIYEINNMIIQFLKNL